MNILPTASLVLCITAGTIKHILPRMGYDVSGMLLGAGNVITIAGVALVALCLAKRDR
nr:hypothetical protein 69 [Balneolaceae bacterium]